MHGQTVPQHLHLPIATVLNIDVSETQASCCVSVSLYACAPHYMRSSFPASSWLAFTLRYETDEIYHAGVQC